MRITNFSDRNASGSFRMKYDEATGILIMPNADFPDVAVDPAERVPVGLGSGEARLVLAAAVELLSPFLKFPFENQGRSLT